MFLTGEHAEGNNYLALITIGKREYNKCSSFEIFKRQ